MKFRLYDRSKDEETLRGMLADEKIPFSFMQHDNPRLETWLMEEGRKVLGFYSWNQQHGMAALVHFIVEKSERNNELARALVKHFISVIKEQKLKQIIVAIPNTNTNLFTFVKYYFKNTEAYAIRDHLLFVKAEV